MLLVVISGYHPCLFPSLSRLSFASILPIPFLALIFSSNHCVERSDQSTCSIKFLSPYKIIQPVHWKMKLINFNIEELLGAMSYPGYTKYFAVAFNLKYVYSFDI